MGRYKPAGEQQPSTGIADYTMMMFKLLTTFLVFGFTSGAPQYGGVQPSSPVKTAPLTGSVQCRTEYATLWDTEYKDDCEYQWEGYGNDKVWAPIAGTCKKNPYETCKDVAKTKEKQVAYPVCNDVPEQKCVDVPKQECVAVPDQICTNQPLQKCQDVPRQNCKAIHKKVCQDAPAGPTNTFVPPFVASGPEVIDARQEPANNQKTILFERSQVAHSKSDNSIVFGD